MFGRHYFGGRYFGGRMFGDGGDAAPPVVVVPEGQICGRSRAIGIKAQSRAQGLRLRSTVTCCRRGS